MAKSDKVTELRGQVEALKQRIAKLEGRDASPPKPAPAPKREEGVRIFEPLPGAPSDLPNDVELRQLVNIVLAGYPELAPGSGLDEQDEFRRSFVGAFTWLCWQGRAEKPDSSRYLSHWIDTANDHLRRAGRIGDVGGASLLAASVAHADVPFVLADRRRGIVAALGLKVGAAGKPYRGAWRGVLANGRCPEPARIA